MEITWLARKLAILFAICSGLVAAANAPAAAPGAEAEYLLGPGDAIHIVVFLNPDLTVDTRVSETGAISFPLLGRVQVGGLALSAAEQRIARGLKDGGYVREPQVNITLLQVRGNQVSVLGQVNKPGRYPLETANMRLSDALAMAGGVSPGGADIVILSGTRAGAAFRREVDLPRMFHAAQPEADPRVADGDVIFVQRAPMFYIYGEAQHPGAYRVERNLTVVQALALGGGLTPRGTERRLRMLRRNAAGKVEELAPALTDLVQPDDVIHVRESLF
ncbi:MAG: polysaccharide export protein EpsE [Rhodocyclaceae bacterium]|nr:polysaccharide export protein EpsE [Rhodocyclaceae bacterium]